MSDAESITPVKTEVLAPQLGLKGAMTKAADIEALFRTTFIPTDRTSQYFRWLEELRLIHQCGRAIGPREVGKSRSSIEYRENDRKRVSYVQAWSNLSSRRLFSQILDDIKHAAHKGRRQDLRSRLSGCLPLFGIDLLIVDNAENLQIEALLDLKQIHEETNVPVVLVGGPELDSHLQKADLLLCFPNLFEFDRLDYEDFCKTVRTIETDILSLPQPSNLSDGHALEDLIVSTEMRIGVLIKVLQRAALHSLKKGHGRLDEAVFRSVAHRHGEAYIPIEARNRKE